MDESHVLESIDRELAFYRQRQVQISYLALAAETLVVTGQATLPTSHPVIARVMFTAFFVLVALFSGFFYRSYVERDDHLTTKRAELIRSTGCAYPFKKPEGFRTRSPSFLTLIIVVLIAIIAIVLTWIGDYGAGPVTDG